MFVSTVEMFLQTQKRGCLMDDGPGSGWESRWAATCIYGCKRVHSRGPRGESMYMAAFEISDQ